MFLVTSPGHPAGGHLPEEDESLDGRRNQPQRVVGKGRGEDGKAGGHYACGVPPDEPAQAVADEREALEQVQDARGPARKAVARRRAADQAAERQHPRPQQSRRDAGDALHQRFRVERVPGPVFARRFRQFQVGYLLQEILEQDPLVVVIDHEMARHRLRMCPNAIVTLQQLDDLTRQARMAVQSPEGDPSASPADAVVARQ